MTPLTPLVNHRAPASRAGRRRGMTLVELAIAVTLAAGLAVAVGQVVTQMTRGAASIDRRSQTQTSAAIAMLRMRSELELAKSVTALTTRKITFVHPDLTGDSVADTVTFEWSGTSGDPLTRAINGNPAETIAEQCRSFAVSTVSPTIRLVAGTRYDLRIEYYENTGSALAKLLWSSPSISKQAVPTARLYPAFTPSGSTAPGSSGTGLIGKYYDNVDFTNLLVTRLDTTVNFDWGTGSPDSTVGNNTFSVRWTGQIKPATTDDYTFYTVSDDGIRLWVDGRLLIENWSDHTSTEDKSVTTGLTTVELHLETGSQQYPARFDGAVSLLNRPSYGG